MIKNEDQATSEVDEPLAEESEKNPEVPKKKGTQSKRKTIYGP